MLLGTMNLPLSGLNKGFLFYSTDDDGGESRTGAAGNSGLGTHPIPRVLLGKVRRLLTAHTLFRELLHTHPRGRHTFTNGSYHRESGRMCR